ncbi:MAG: hypothetical protein GXO79_12795 [Chlorobi bacterium]|nr:hypothetical protein [Chlorobiota bacterium]
MKRQLINIILLLFYIGSYSQEVNTVKEFKPSGHVFGKIHSNFHFGISETNKNSAFEITRAYFGYKYNFSEYLSMKTNIDVGNPHVNIGDTLKGNTSLQQTAYLKTAALSFAKGKLAFYVGLIGLIQFKEQEKVWGHRYIYKSFQDEYKFGPSADLGFIAKYLLMKNLQVDLTIRNGEGYKKLQSDNNYKSGIGTSLYLGNFMARVYYEVIQTNIVQSIFAGFLSYQHHNKLISGIEYNFQKNVNFISGRNLWGMSVYSSYSVNKKFEVFGRFDILTSNKLAGESDNWNISKDGMATIAGIQYSLAKKVKVSVNYRNWISLNNPINDEPNVYINFEYKF